MISDCMAITNLILYLPFEIQWWGKPLGQVANALFNLWIQSLHANFNKKKTALKFLGLYHIKQDNSYYLLLWCLMWMEELNLLCSQPLPFEVAFFEAGICTLDVLVCVWFSISLLPFEMEFSHLLLTSWNK